MAATVTKPTITYFNFLALAEGPRLILEDAGVDYDYVGLERSQWGPLKRQYQTSGSLPLNPNRQSPSLHSNPFHLGTGKSPFGQLPIYEEPGLSLVQSGAILRYLANKHGYAGASALESALIDQVYEGVTDMRMRLSQWVFQSPEDKKPEMKQKFLTEYLPEQLAIFTKLLEKNGNNGYLVGSKVGALHLGEWPNVERVI